jgi:esterase FrsA
MMHAFEVDPDIEAAYIGPPLSSGPLPCLFYFSLSAKDSLGLDPFNQPVVALSSLPLRIFSITLPGHEEGLPPTQALQVWASALGQGDNLVGRFIDRVNRTVSALESRGALICGRLAVAGLSRGAFMATHVAAANPKFRQVLGFAPLTKLLFAKEFQHISHLPPVKSLSLEHQVGNLFDRNLRFYIGNLDTRVGTRHCFDFIEKLAQRAYNHTIRSPKVELIIGPSIGRDGHGTPKEIFEEGARWIARQLGMIDAV